MVSNWTVQCTAHDIKLDGTVYSTWYQGGRYSVQHRVSNWTVQCTTHGIKLDCSVYTAHGIKLDGTVYGYSVEHMMSNLRYSVHCTVYSVQHMVADWTVQCTVYSTWYKGGFDKFKKFKDTRIFCTLRCFF